MCESQEGAGKRPRTSPKLFQAGAAPPPSAAHAARRAQAAKETAEVEEAVVNAQSAERAAEVEMGDKRASVAVEDEASETRPQLLGTQVRVLWGDKWYQGVGGDSKVEDGVWITHVAYDASGGWPKCSNWHNLAIETWEQM